MRLAAFVDNHLREEVQIDRASAETYYREKLLPELRQRGVSADPPFAEVAGEIEDILREQHKDEQLTSWLHTLRQQSTIRIGTRTATLARQ